jgi:hypothetical protein
MQAGQSNSGGAATNDEKYFFAYSASLRIFGDIPDMDAISATLGLAPTHSHRRGERRRGNGAPYPHDMWSYDASVDKSEPLGKHIDALWASLKPHKKYLLELKKSLTVDVFLGYRSDCDHAGVEVPHTSLEIFRELEIPFGLSIIIA